MVDGLFSKGPAAIGSGLRRTWITRGRIEQPRFALLLLHGRLRAGRGRSG